MSRIYLDHAATTPMVPEAVEAMTRELTRVGNASSLHASGRSARRVVEESREAIAAQVGASPAELIFTSGGTESDNLAIKGAFWSGAEVGSPSGGHLDDRTPRRAGFRRLARSVGGGRGELRSGRLCWPTGSIRSRRARRRANRAGLGDVGQQRGRHPAAGTRDRRGRRPPGRDLTQRRGPGRRSHRGRLCSKRAGPADLHSAQARRAVRDRCPAGASRASAGARSCTVAVRSETCAPALST